MKDDDVGPGHYDPKNKKHVKLGSIIYNIYL
jgi:hypothetical protein